MPRGRVPPRRRAARVPPTARSRRQPARAQSLRQWRARRWTHGGQDLTETPSTFCSAGRSMARGASISMGSPTRAISARRRGICRGSSIAIVSSGGAASRGASDLRGSGSSASGASGGAAGPGPGDAPAGRGIFRLDRFQIGNLLEGLSRRLEQPPHASSDVRPLTTMRWNCRWICGTAPGSRYT